MPGLTWIAVAASAPIEKESEKVSKGANDDREGVWMDDQCSGI